MADGRLDEAYELARKETLREHRTGQRLIGQLVPRLIERGGMHLAEGRPREALEDCAKAERLAGNTTEVTRLRCQAIRVIDAAEREKRQRRERIDEAQRHVTRGRLTSAQRVLAGCGPEESGVGTLQRDLHERQETVATSLRVARETLEAGNVLACAEHLHQARQARAAESDLQPIATALTRSAVDTIRAALDAGRLDQADLLLRAVRRCSGSSLDLDTLNRAMADCRAARRSLKARRPTRAATALARVHELLPEAVWIIEALEHARAAAGRLQSLRHGPLGLLDNAAKSESRTPLPFGEGRGVGLGSRRAHLSEPCPSPIPNGEESVTSHVPPLFLMQIDGVGSFLVAASAHLTLGPISSSKRPDIGLIADPDAPVISVRRTEEDYFVESSRPVTVGGRAAGHALLSDGADIQLSPRCRLRFRRPNPASTSAVLDLTGARLAGCDARRIILLDRDLIIGPGPSAHIPAPSVARPLVLRWQHNRLTYAGQVPCTIDGQTHPAPAELPVHARIAIGPLSFVVTEARR